MKIKKSYFIQMAFVLALTVFMSNTAFSQCSTFIIGGDPASGTTALTSTFYGGSSAVATEHTFNGGSLPAGWSASPYTIGQLQYLLLTEQTIFGLQQEMETDIGLFKQKFLM